MALSSDDNYLNIDDVAEYLGVKPPTVRSWIKNRGLPHYRMGGKLLKFKRAEIDEWVKCTGTAPQLKVDIDDKFRNGF